MSDGRWTFVHVADMQPGSPRSFRFRPAWLENWHAAMEQIRDQQPELVLVGGDLTRDGSIHRWELEQARDDLQSMEIPYHVVPGNMDTGNKHAPAQGSYDERDDLSLNITTEQLEQFESVFGRHNWTVDHRNARFTGFCDMLIGSGLPSEKELWRWLASLAELPPVDHHVVVMHYALFADELDEPTWDITRRETYLDWYFTIDRPHRLKLWEVFRRIGVTRVISGHIHCRRTDEHVVDGIALDWAPATCGGQWADRWADGDTTPGFTRYDVDGTDIRKTFVALDPPSTRTDGYGPGGHPKPEARDYSKAWEQS
ncbi:MAG: metallophosphoesterase family protein [Planctomycetota bacterium]